jgi:DNA-directed RNA polymerase II subunit RPB1
MFIPDVNVRRESAWHQDKEQRDFSAGDTQVLIEQGELLAGTLCKKTVGSGAGGLVHIIWEEHGPHAARSFLNQTQTCVNYWLLQHGFSVGIGDTIADAKTLENIAGIIQRAKDDVKEVVKQAQEKKLEPQPGRTIQESFEQKVNGVLNKARDDAGKEAQGSIPETNRVLRMVTAGSKGSHVNISQMMACVGQQNVEARTPPPCKPC